MNLLNKLSNWYFKKAALPYWGILLLDCLAVLIAGYYGNYSHFGGLEFTYHFWPITWGLLLTVAIFLVAFRIFHTYSGVIRYSSFVDLQYIVLATASASTVCFFLSKLLNRLQIQSIITVPVDGIIPLFLISTLLMWLIRIGVKSLYDFFRSDPNKNKVFIYGVRSGAVALAKGIRNSEEGKYEISGFISPDGYLVGQYLMGAKVYEETINLADQIKSSGATAIIVSPLQVEHFRDQQDLINDLTQAGIKIMLMPNPQQWDGKSDINSINFKEVEVEDLLPRDQIEIDMAAIAQQLKGKCILITGAAGSIGSEMVRQVASFEPKQLVLIDQAETPMHDIRLMMARQFPGVPAATVVASITNAPFMECLFAQYRPEFVFHAAAYKHVPMMEDNPAMAVQNNIRGTRVIADLAVKYGVRKFVMISTDKAVNPTNVMGCSKRICEIYCQSLNAAIQDGKVPGTTQFVTTRFGNVLGSNGSVIPLFREQIKAGGPVTVTHPDIIRFFMLIPEACKLVLEAGAIGHGGEIFAFDMGKPVRITDLAKRMIAMSGNPAIKIEFTGLRDGEKLYEEVLSDAEKTIPTPNPKIFVASVREYDYAEARGFEDQLLELSFSGTSLEIVRLMQSIVPEYQSTNREYK